MLFRAAYGDVKMVNIFGPDHGDCCIGWVLATSHGIVSEYRTLQSPLVMLADHLKPELEYVLKAQRTPV